MATAILQFLIAMGFIVAAGIFLTRSADAIAEISGLGRLLVGSLFLAGATSLPELAVDINAVWLGLPNMAVGDLLGSCLFNLLILAIADISQWTPGQMLTRTAAAHALSGALSIAMAATVGIFLVFETQVTTDGLWGISYGAVAIFLVYVFGVRISFLDQRAMAKKLEAAAVDSADSRGMTLRRAVLGYSASAIVILLAAPLLASSGGRIAELSGLGGTFVGTVFVAMATSLPELVATLAAVRMNAFDLAIGNVFGSNAFNLLMLLPLDLVHPGSLFGAVEPTHALTCLSVILATSVVIMGQLYRVEKRVLFIEPDAGLVIALVLGTLWMVFLAHH